MGTPLKIPWQVKMRLKIALGAMPGLKEQLTRFLPIFRHGPLDDPDYYLRNFCSHYGRYLELADPISSAHPPVLLELGPGFSLISALLGDLFGARQVILIDVGEYASLPQKLKTGILERIETALDTPASSPEQEKPEHQLIRLSTQRSLITIEEIRDKVKTFSQMENPRQYLAEQGILNYRTGGLQSLREIPPETVHFSFSQAVLEHVLREEFTETLEQIFRMTIPGGLSRHVVDFKDHLAGSLNSLKFSQARWERKAVYHSTFYTNRLRCSDVKKAFQQAGWETVESWDRMWESLPVAREKLHPDFQHYSDEELCCSGLVIVGKKPKNPIQSPQ